MQVILNVSDESLAKTLDESLKYGLQVESFIDFLLFGRHEHPYDDKANEAIDLMLAKEPKTGILYSDLVGEEKADEVNNDILAAVIQSTLIKRRVMNVRLSKTFMGGVSLVRLPDLDSEETSKESSDQE